MERSSSLKDIKKTKKDKSTANTTPINELPTLSLPSKSFKKIDNQFLYFKKFVIGTGSFGKVLYGMNIEKTNEFAIKFEKSTVKNSVIGEEIKILNDLKGGVGVPEIYWYGRFEEYKVMTMDLLGPSLDKFFKICGKKFTMETTVNLGIEMLSRIEYVHFKGYLHRDIKPNNFLLGKFQRNSLSTCDKNLVYIIDFGLSKTYLEEDTGLHYDYKDDRKFVGTPRYASLNTHIGVRQSRRDDIESIVYILIYFLKGELPWQGVKAKTKSEKKEKIKNKKKIVTIFEMCLGLPPQFTKLFEFVRNLKFEETPDYNYMRGILTSIKSIYNFNDIISNSNLEWEWDKMFLKSKQYLSKENHDEKIYNHYKKYYEKLYEGYPAPSYEEYLDNLENSKLNYPENKSPSQMMEINDEKKNENFITSHLNSNGGNNLRIFLNK